LNWDLWQGPAAVHPFNAQVLGPGWWRRCRDYSAGPIGQNGTHAYDMIQYAMGADESGPVEYRLLEEGPAGRVRFRYANGVEVRLKYPLGGASPYRDQPPSPGPQMGAIFVGEKCKIEINRNKFTANPKDFVANGPDPKLADKWYGPDWIARPHVQNWLDCIKTRQKPNADVEVGHRSAAICHVINIVRELGRAGETLQWDPASERFTNSKEGNELLDRPRRKGWELPAV
jgi:predicted dehydrogenase